MTVQLPQYQLQHGTTCRIHQGSQNTNQPQKEVSHVHKPNTRHTKVKVCILELAVSPLSHGGKEGWLHYVMYPVFCILSQNIYCLQMV